MAAPSDVDCTNLSGKFVMNKTTSDPIDPVLALQGISWFVRKAIGLATVILTIKEYTDKDEKIHIDIVSVASGLSTTEELRTLDWVGRPHTDKIFGKVEGKSRMFKKGSYEKAGPASDFDQTFLKGEQLKDGTETKFLDDDLVQAYVKSADGGNWEAEVVWGFEEVNKERRYTRRTIVWKGDKVQRCRLVYDWQGKADKQEDDGLAYGD